MIVASTQFNAGQLKILGLASVQNGDLLAAEVEVFDNVFEGVSHDEVDTLPEGTLRTLFASILAPFVFVQLSRNRNAYLKQQGEVTATATAYGRTTTSRLLEVWNAGVIDGKRRFYGNLSLFRQTFEHVALVASIKL